jgi:signal transduction histidine kinase
VRRRRIYEWLRRHPYVVDAGIVALLFAFPALSTFGPLPRYELVFAIGLLLPLVWRRSHPVAVFSVVSATCFVQLLLGDRLLASDVGFLLAVYAVSAYARQQWARYGALAVGGLGAFLGPLDWSTGRDGSLFVSAVFLAAPVALTWTLGDLMRTRRAYVGELEERARRLEFERDQQARLARASERARIARELHDVVAHSLSVVIAQADGGRYAGETDPEAALRALTTIGTTGRQALAEMRRLLGVLRSEAGDDGLAPQPGLDDLESLVAQVRASGLPVTLHVEGTPTRLSGGRGLAAFRVVQEALTNVLKHAGPAAQAVVHLRFGDDVLEMEISDDGRGAAAADDGGGQGVHGMRERMALYGGTVHAGPRAGGGFVVRATLPLDTTADESERLENV